MVGDYLKVLAKLAEFLERPLAWAVHRLPGLFPATALIYILVDIIVFLPNSAEDRKMGWDILRFDRNPTINVFHMESSLGTLLIDSGGRPDPVKINDDINHPVKVPDPADRTGKTLIAQLNADEFYDSLLFLTEQADKKLSDSGKTSKDRPTLEVRCKKGEDPRTFVKEQLYFAAPKLGQVSEIGTRRGPQLAFNQSSRVNEIALSHREMAQLIQSDVPNVKCYLSVASDIRAGNIPVGAVRLIGERRITRYIMVALGALALWIAGAWVLEQLRRGIAILD